MKKTKQRKAKPQSLTPKWYISFPLTWKYKNMNDRVWSYTINFTWVVLFFNLNVYLFHLKKLENHQFEIWAANTLGQQTKNKNPNG